MNSKKNEFSEILCKKIDEDKSKIRKFFSAQKKIERDLQRQERLNKFFFWQELRENLSANTALGKEAFSEYLVGKGKTV